MPCHLFFLLHLQMAHMFRWVIDEDEEEPFDLKACVQQIKTALKLFLSWTYMNFCSAKFAKDNSCVHARLETCDLLLIPLFYKPYFFFISK